MLSSKLENWVGGGLVYGDSHAAPLSWGLEKKVGISFLSIDEKGEKRKDNDLMWALDAVGI